MQIGDGILNKCITVCGLIHYICLRNTPYFNVLKALFDFCGDAFGLILLCYWKVKWTDVMKIYRMWVQLLIFIVGFLGLVGVGSVYQIAKADPIYLNPYLLQGEAIGSVLDIEPTVSVLSEQTTIDVRDWLPSLKNPLLLSTTTYRLSTSKTERFALFLLNGNKEPKIELNGERLQGFIAQYPLSKIFYENSFRNLNIQQNPLGALLKKENVVGVSVPRQELQLGNNELNIKQVFDVRTDSTHFTRRYTVFVLNPQWQGQLTGLLKAWDVSVEVLVPPSWGVRSDLPFDRTRDVVTFHLDPSQAALECELLPPHSNHLYKLIKSSLWLTLIIVSLITAFISYAGAIFVERMSIPPRVMMLAIVVLCMGIDWTLANQISNHLQTEAFLNHLSLMTLQEIQHNHWVHQFYGAILVALIACLVFLRTLEISFFVEKPVLPEESPEYLEPVEETLLDEGIQPPDFTLLNDAADEDEEPSEFFVMGSMDNAENNEDGSIDTE